MSVFVVEKAVSDPLGTMNKIHCTAHKPVSTPESYRIAKKLYDIYSLLL